MLAVASGWHESKVPARIVLVAAAVYTSLSLVVPLYLVGPVKRFVLTKLDLTVAAQADSPEQKLAERAANAAMANDLQNQRISNLLDAARRELIYAGIALLLWVVLVPLTGLLKH